VALADRVALLQDGELVAVGTHSELMAKVPAYRSVLSESAGAERAAS
jgi:ATP-binding cassette subfamily B protein